MSAASQRSTPPKDEEALGPARPLPTDPREREALLGHIERGVTDALENRGVDWDELDRRLSAKFGFSPRGKFASPTR